MKASIFRRPFEPLTIETVEVAEPLPHEVLVKTVASGLCHSDAHSLDGLRHLRWGENPTVVLGHEGAGIVEAVGDAVTAVQPGDHVVACLSGWCGECPQCLRGRPNLCTGKSILTRKAGTQPRLSQGGKPVTQGSEIASHAEWMLLHERSLVKIDPEIPLDRAALVGCAVTTGLGAAMRTSGLRAAQTAAVFGCGGVGLSIIQGARIAGARQVIAVDQFDAKLRMAEQMGATHLVNATKVDAVAEIRRLTGGKGVDHSFEAVGLPVLAEQAVRVLAIAGTATIVGVMPDGATLQFPWESLHPECKVQTSRMGSNAFRLDIPAYLDLYRSGRLLLDEMVSRTIPLEEINAGFQWMKEGEVARTVIVFD